MNRLIIGLLILGIFSGRVGWVTLTAGVYMMHMLYRLWLHGIRDATETTIAFDPGRIHVDEEGNLRIQLTNRFWLPLYVRLEFVIDSAVAISGVQSNHLEGFRQSSRAYTLYFLLPARGGVDRKLSYTAKHRGTYWMDQVTLHIKDPLGLTESSRELSLHPGVIAYPKAFPVFDMGKIMKEPIGEHLSHERLLQEDHAFYIGSRDYQRGDPFKRLDWNATAKAQTLQTKQYDYTVHGKVYIVLDPPYVQPDNEEQKAELEQWIGALSTLVTYCHHRGIVFRLLINSSFRASKRFTETPWSNGRNNYFGIMELLAKLKVNKWVQFPVLIHQIVREKRHGNGVIVMKARWKDEDWAALGGLEQRGYRIWVAQRQEAGITLHTLDQIPDRKGDPDGQRAS